jgi:hypothetical protein
MRIRFLKLETGKVINPSGRTQMVHIADFKLRKRSGCISRVWLSIGLSLFSCAASAQTYPISGVWIAEDNYLPGSTSGACSLLKKFGVDAPLTQSFPEVMIFSGEKRFEMRGDFYSEATLRSVKAKPGGVFQIIERREKPGLFHGKARLTITVVDAITIDLTERNASTRLYKCSSNSSRI